MPDSAADTATDSTDAPDPALTGYVHHPAEFAIMPIEGDYDTPTGRGKFHVKVRDLDIHIFTGWRARKRAFDEPGDILFFNTQELIRDAVFFVRRAGPEGVKLGSVKDNYMPEPDTFEAWLREKSFAMSGQLASYFPSILAKLGAIRFERRDRALWAVPADRIEEE